MTAAAVAHALCALTSVLCAGLLVRSYRASRVRLMLWAAICFLGLAVNNVLLVIDSQVLPDVDLSLLRDVSGFVSVTLLLLGLVWESR